MYLFKCNCGSLFTLSAEALSSDRWISCPECGKKIRFNTFTTVDEWQKELSSLEWTLNKIPDTAKIEVSYHP